MQKRYYFTLLLFICILSGHAQTIVLSPEDKKIFLKNFQTVLQHLPTKFAKIKTGGEDWDITNRISWYKSNLQLLPGQADKNKNQLMYGTYNSKPVIAFIEEVPVVLLVINGGSSNAVEERTGLFKFTQALPVYASGVVLSVL